ncbi:MAG: putative lipid II flippase FtsW [Acidobacteriota bacterium]
MKPRMPYDRILILLVLTLLGVGLVMVFSASAIISKGLYDSSTAIFTKQLYSVILGLILMVVVMRIDYRLFANRFIVGLLVAGSLGLLGWALMSRDINDVHRWIQLGPMRFQPSEVAKLAVIFMTAYLLVKRGGRIRTIDRPMIVYLGVLGMILVLVLAEPDFGTTTSLALTAALLLFAGGFPIRYYLGAALAALPLFFFLVYQVPYRRMRLFAFLHPEADPFGASYQVLQSLIAVGSGGLAGKGLAQGTQKLFFLPEPHTDFIYAVIGEETGLWGCALVLLLFLLLLWRGLRAAIRSDTLFGTYVGLGIVSMITLQALFNMSVVLSLCPTKGIPLPFISVGGSSVLVMLTAMGILLNISKHAQSALPGSAVADADPAPTAQIQPKPVLSSVVLGDASWQSSAVVTSSSTATSRPFQREAAASVPRVTQGPGGGG